VVRCDNIMAENVSSGVQTKHIDTKYHFIQEHMEDEFIKLCFVKSSENKADLFTKNVSRESYVEHVSKFLGRINDKSEK
jgi:hypothetical protein